MQRNCKEKIDRATRKEYISTIIVGNVYIHLSENIRSNGENQKGYYTFKLQNEIASVYIRSAPQKYTKCINVFI